MGCVAEGTVVLGAWSGHSVLRIFEISWERFSSANNLMLMLVILQVISLSRQMSEAGVMKDLVAAVQSKVSRRVSIAALPAVIGLLPMPGGAAFSAPLVDDCDRDKSIEPLLKTRINYWFRHVWEYWWPLYPGVLLALEVTKLEPWQLMSLHIPLSICSIAVGYLFLLRKVRGPTDNAHTAGAEGGRNILILLTPVLIIIATYASIKLLLPQVGEVNRYMPMAAGILLAILVLQYQRPLDSGAWRSILLSKKSFMLAALVAIIRIYGAFIETELPGGKLLVEKMGEELDAFGIPLMAVIMVIPFVAGLATGVAVGFVGAGLPIVISLSRVAGEANVGALLSTTALAYGFGYMGMILSPVHICLIVTNEHFKTRLSNTLYRLLPPAAVVLALVTLYYFLVRRIFSV